MNVRYRVFAVPTSDDGAVAEELNHFLAGHRVVHVDRHLVADGAASPAGGVRVRVEAGERRVQRGGSWINNAHNARSAYRDNWEPGNRNDNNGFRIARALRGAGGRPLDQTRILSARTGGEQHMAAGMPVLGAEAPGTLAGRPPFLPAGGARS